ncbi:hypothetical protein ACNRC9_24220, partial [Ralstonia pseudosolanacearum]|uniref:hypothetical protein n=1 Tax=Ralstonia pseudosolanacearum TaxID=1310165 RepID=UPI003AAF91EC
AHQSSMAQEKAVGFALTCIWSTRSQFPAAPDARAVEISAMKLWLAGEPMAVRLIVAAHMG